MDNRPVLGLQMVQKQSMLMIPQIIQSVEILQLPMQALQERIDQELAENPVLEVADQGPSPEEESGTDEELDVPDIASPPSEKIANFEASDDFQQVETMAQDYPDFFDEGNFTGRRYNYRAGEKDAKLDAMQNTPGRRESLQDYLFHQLCLNELTQAQRVLAENIIYNIDNNGYLQFTLEEIARSMDEPATVEELREILIKVQNLDPPGIGARSLQECLLIQARIEMGLDSDEVRLLQDHFDLFKKGNFEQIAPGMGISQQGVQQLVASIAHLNPQPGSVFADSESLYVIPDVIVEKNDGVYEIRLHDEKMPRLYVSDSYRPLLKRGGGQSTDTKQYIRGKIQSARWLIEAIQQRRKTLRKVAAAIVGHQLEFMEKGESVIRPLRMKTLAGEIGIHVATVCRAVANKYMETPQGVFPMRHFFPTGYTSQDGQQISDRVVRQSIQKIVDEENKSRPLSDEAIMKIFNDQGIPIARRTITKYRKILGIPSSRQRKKS